MKNGYKKTSLGILPSEWEVVKLGDICKFYKGKGISKNDISKNGINCIRYGELYTIYDEKINKIYSKTNLNPKNLFLSKFNDIIIPSSGETAIEISKASCVLLDNVALGGDLNVLRTKENGIFISYYLNHMAKNEIAKLAQGFSIVHLYEKELKTLKIPLPPLNEQRKIAEILSSYDEAILLTSNLISAKKEFKKALMQNLLTAKICFPNFNGIWKEVKLGKFIKEQTIRNTKNINLVLSVTNKFGFVEQSNYFEKEVASKDTSNYKVIKNGNFAYNPSRINVGSIALLENFEVGILSPMYVIFDCLDGINKKFLKYWLQSHNFTGNLYKYLAGSVRETLNFKDMKNFKIKLPNLAEQTKIAEILSSVDDEIDLLNQKLEQLNLQKRGIMQNLLSGKIRVKL